MLSIKDDVIEMVDLSESTSASKPTAKRPIKSNKIASPPIHSPISTAASDGSDVFLSKSERDKSNRPRPKPRSRRIPSETISEIQDMSELSYDASKVSTASSGVGSSRTEAKTYKEVIRRRFHAVKRNAGKSTEKAAEFTEKTKKVIMERLRKENRDVDAELENIRRRIRDNHHFDRSECNNFFYGEANDPKKEDGEPENAEEAHQSTQTLLETKIANYKAPEHLYACVKNAESELLCHPTGREVELNKKIEEAEIRNLGDEGLYVCPQPAVSKVHLNLTEERLLSVDDRKWFDCEGKLKILPDPTTRTSTRSRKHDIPKGRATVYAKPYLEDDECAEIVVTKENILDLQLLRLKFTHHPLFSIEHVLKRDLLKNYDEYAKYKNFNTLQKLKNKLDALDHLKSNWENVAETREAFFAQSKYERQLARRILEVWRLIRIVRDRNGYSSTRVKLVIHIQQTDRKKERKEQELYFEKCLDQLMAEYDAKAKSSSVEPETTQSESEGDTENRNRIRTEKRLRKELRRKFEECLKPAGEPTITFGITNVDVTKNIDDSKENLRRSMTLSTKLYLRVICDNVEVSKSKILHLNDDFVCHFNEVFAILLTSIPRSLKIEVIEQSQLHKRKVGEVDVPVPPMSKIQEQRISEWEFHKDDVVQCKHAGVGSGIKLADLLKNFDLELDCEGEELKTSAILSCVLAWESSARTQGNFPNLEQSIDIDEIIDKYGSVNLGKLSEWVERNAPDPQDPKNCALYDYLRGCREHMLFLASQNRNYFRLDPHISSMRFCDIAEIEDNARLKMLRLRNQNEPEFDGMVVPNRLKEIPLYLLADYRKRASEEDDALLNQPEVEDFEEMRLQGRKVLKQIYTKIFQKCKSCQHNLTYVDVVDEKSLVHFENLVKTLVANFLNWFSWRPRVAHPLPDATASDVATRKQAERVVALATVCVRVFSGSNIPSRTSDDPVNAFVEIKYNDVSVKTSAVQGSNPAWNQELDVALDSMHLDYLNPNSLSGFLIVNLYDETNEGYSRYPDEKFNNFLGYLEVPMSAVCCSDNLEGMFKLNTPKILFGYVKGEKTTPGKSHHTYLNLRFSVRPNVPKLSPSIAELPCNDLPYLKDHVLAWNERYNQSFPNRRFSALTIDANGRTTCVVRYIRPLEPPQLSTEGFDVTTNQILRFVSLIPFTDCNQFYQNVWLTTGQLLQFLVGSVIDHAVSLTCFLRALKLDVWLLLGFGIPHGSGAYVLMREHQRDSELPTYSFFDVVQGEKFNMGDLYCPLQRVYCVIGEENVWANVQRNENVSAMRFDFSRRSDWLPLFTNEIPAPTNPMNQNLSHTKRWDTGELELQLDKKIKKKISKARTMDRTIWNSRVANAIKRHLVQLEFSAMHGKDDGEIVKELKGALSGYEISGYVLCLPFTTMSDITRKIISHGIHKRDDTNEFVLAVHMEAYADKMASTWIFLSSLKSKT